MTNSVPDPLPDPAPDLRGITLIDLAGVGPAARCVRVLADLGARWIRLVPPPGAGRVVPPWYAYGGLRGAQPMGLDLKSPRAKDVFLRLAASADIIIECFRPGVADRLGIGYREVERVNPRIVYCATTGYGQSGPYAQLAGHDLNYQALAGSLAAAGRRADGGPAMPGLTLADSAGGAWQAVIRILSALIARQSSGRGRYLDVAASEGVLHLMDLVIDEHLAGGRESGLGAEMFTGRYACYDIYRAADGWLAVAALETKFFATLCEALGLAQLAPLHYAPDAQDRIRREFAAAFFTQTRAQWQSRLAGLDCCVTPVLAVDELAGDPHWQARGVFREYIHPDRGAALQVGPFGDKDAERGAAPSAAQTQADGILGGFGFSAAEIAALKVEGVVA